jgi:mannosyltransferase
MLGIAAATAAAFFLRTYGAADQGGLEWDEAFSAALASLPPLEIVRYCLGALQEHPPLFYLLLHGWMALAGDSEAALRMAASLPSTLAVSLVGAALAAVAGGPVGVIAAWALALAPLDIYFGRFVRMYGLLTLLMALLLAGAALLSARKREPGGLLLVGTALLGTLATSYFFLFAVAGPALVVAFDRVRRRVLVGGGAAAAGLLGLWIAVSPGFRETLALRVQPRAPDAGRLVELLGASFGAIAWPSGPERTAAILMAVIAAVVVLQWLRRGAEQPLTGAALAGFLVSAVGVPILTLIGVFYAPRYLAIAMPAAAALIGLALGRWPGALGAAGALGLALATLPMLPPVLGQRVSSDYALVAADLRARAEPGDAVVLNGPAQWMWYRRYAENLPRPEILVVPEGEAAHQQFAARASGRGLTATEASQGLERIAGRAPRIWDLESGTGNQDPEGLVGRWLDRHGYPVETLRHASATLRLYLTDGGRAPLEMRARSIGALDMHVEQVGLDSWTPAVGSQMRLLVAGTRAGGNGALKGSVRLVGPEGVEGSGTIWEQDLPLVEEGNRLELRAAPRIGMDAMPGRYQLHLVVYQVGSLPAGGSGITRTSDVVPLGEVAIGP